MTEIHCTTCGNPTQPGERFCRVCGAFLCANDAAGQEAGSLIREMNTAELLDIWQGNHRAEYSEADLALAAGILRERQVQLPQRQAAPFGLAEDVLEDEPVVEGARGHYPAEYNPLESGPSSDQVSHGCLAALTQSLLNGGGRGGYRHRVHRAYRPRLHASVPPMRMPARATRVSRSVLKGRHK